MFPGSITSSTRAMLKTFVIATHSFLAGRSQVCSSDNFTLLRYRSF